MIRANVSVTNSRPSSTLTTGLNSSTIRTELASVLTANRLKQEALHSLKSTTDDAILSSATLTNPILTLSEQSTASVAPVLVVPSSYLLSLSTQNAEDSMAIKRNFTNNNNSTDGSSFSDDDDDSSFDDEPCSNKMLRADVAVDYSRSSYSSSPTTSEKQSVKTGPRRHTGPRKPRAYEKLTPEEEERRRVRRERNKHAAAKCRQKRVDLTNCLLAETEKLQSEQLKLQNEIKEFQREKDELEFILEAHRLHCGVGKSNGMSIDLKPEIKTDDEVVVEDEETVSTTVIVSTKSAVSRPTTLSASFISPLSSMATPSNHVAGIAITTPTAGLNVFTLGLESMMDGHTGLTPITGLPVAFAGISTPVVIAGISGSQLLLAGGGNTQQVLAEETVSTPCNGDTGVTELI